MTYEELISYCEATARQNEILMKRYDDASVREISRNFQGNCGAAQISSGI